MKITTRCHSSARASRPTAARQRSPVASESWTIFCCLGHPHLGSRPRLPPRITLFDAAASPAPSSLRRLPRPQPPLLPMIAGTTGTWKEGEGVRTAHSASERRRGRLSRPGQSPRGPLCPRPARACYPRPGLVEPLAPAAGRSTIVPRLRRYGPAHHAEQRSIAEVSSHSQPTGWADRSVVAGFDEAVETAHELDEGVLEVLRPVRSPAPGRFRGSNARPQPSTRHHPGDDHVGKHIVPVAAADVTNARPGTTLGRCAGRPLASFSDRRLYSRRCSSMPTPGRRS